MHTCNHKGSAVTLLLPRTLAPTGRHGCSCRITRPGSHANHACNQHPGVCMCAGAGRRQLRVHVHTTLLSAYVCMCACRTARAPGVRVCIHAGCSPLGWPQMGLCSSAAHSKALCQWQGKGVDVHMLCVEDVQVTCSKVVVKEMHRQVHKHTNEKTDRFTRQNTILYLQFCGKGQSAA